MVERQKFGVIGKMHSGKTTAAQYLISEHGFHREAFADPVKEISAEMLNTMARALGQGRTDYTIQTMNAIKGQAPIRKLLQLVGTELGREFFGPDTIWIDKLVARIEHSWYTRLVNDDCRFPNEADALKNVGFTLIRIQRPEEERLESVRTSIRTADPSLTPEQVEKRLEETQNHPSETEQRFIMADITLYNNGSLSDLHDALNDVVEGRIKGGIVECKPYEVKTGGLVC